MSEIKKRTTMISEVARQRLGITRDEYALCSYLQYRASDPRQKITGWCCDNKEEIAEFVGVTRPGLYKMVQRMAGLELLESGFSGAMRATAKWIDSEQECKLSLQSDKSKHTNGVNLVDKKCKQSLHEDVNKVYESIIIKVEEDNKEEKDDYKKAATDFSPLEAETLKTPSPSVAPAPLPAPPVGEYRTLNIKEEVERLVSDPFVLENFRRRTQLPETVFSSYVGDFALHVQTLQKTYSNVPEFRSHFFNYCDKHKNKAMAQNGRRSDGLLKGMKLL